jgi:REP element-mobilizing transposase RayT
MRFELGKVTVHKRNRLPHWDAEHGIQFVTFNLFDALPRHVNQQIQDEAAAQAALIRNTRGDLTLAEKSAIRQWVEARVGDSLDEAHGSSFMREPRIAQIVANAVTHFDEDRYRLLAWCVMPNHVHVVLMGVVQLERVVHSWKSFTAKQANLALGRAGPFWREDYYNRVVRDSRELSATIDYVLMNPAKAGLEDWPFVRSYPERIPPADTAGGWRAGRPPY